MSINKADTPLISQLKVAPARSYKVLEYACLIIPTGRQVQELDVLTLHASVYYSDIEVRWRESFRNGNSDMR